MPSKVGVGKRLRAALDRRFEIRKRVSQATISAVQKDSADRVIGATASVDGLVAQRIYVDHGSNLQVGDVLEVVNRGGAAAPAWYSLRRISTTIPIPTLPFGTILPTPFGLELQAGTYLPIPGGSYSGYIDAQWRRIDQVYGAVSYQFECRRNDVAEDDPVVRTIPGMGGLSSLPAAVSDSDTVIPFYIMVADFSFTKHGVIKIGSELIYYSNMTRTGGCPFIYPYTLDTAAVYLLDYVEDSFTDTDSTDLVSHTPDYDRFAGGWYVIPTYSSNWDIQSNKASATPGGTWPYSAALIRSNSASWTNLRVSATWTWPASGQFGYIVDYDDASNFVYVRYDASNDLFEIIERVSGSETTAWALANVLEPLIAGTAYQFEVVLRSKTVSVRIYDSDDNPMQFFELTDVLTNSVGSEIVGLWSDVAVTVDDFLFDDARFTKFGDDDEWNNFAYYAEGQTLRAITDSGYSATNHRYEITLSGAPGASGGAIYPTFYGCTRGYVGTTAAAHVADAGIIGQTIGVSVKGLDPGIDYNVRVRAYKTEEVYSLWTEWHSINTAFDTTAPSAPTGFDVDPGNYEIAFSWTGPTVDTCADLAGFNIYKATDANGTGATLFATATQGLRHSEPAAPGTDGYFNVKAVDFSGNESDYAETTGNWVYGISGSPSTGQLTLNADWELGNPTANTIEHWDLDLSYSGGSPTMSYGDGYGVHGGRGIYIYDTSGNCSPDVSVAWPLSLSWKVEGVEGAVYMASLHVIVGSGVDVTARLGAHNGTAISWLTGYMEPTERLEAVGSWYRHQFYKKWSSPGSGYDYLAIQFMYYSATPDFLLVYMDRPQLELGVVSTPWALVTDFTGVASDGLRLDSSGIISGDLNVDVDGQFTSGLVPAQDDTSDIGVASTNEWKDIHIAGDLNYSGDLKPTRASVQYTGALPVPFTTPIGHGSFDGDSFSDVGTYTKIENTSWNTALPADAKALLIRLRCRDSASATTSGLFVALSGDGTNSLLVARPSGKPNDDFAERICWMPCTNGDIWYRVEASGTDTMDIFLHCFGWML